MIHWTWIAGAFAVLFALKLAARFYWLRKYGGRFGDHRHWCHRHWHRRDCHRRAQRLPSDDDGTETDASMEAEQMQSTP